MKRSCIKEIRDQTQKCSFRLKALFMVPLPLPLHEDVMMMMMASILLEKAEQVCHQHLQGKAKQTQILQKVREQSTRKRMQSMPSIGLSIFIVEWLLGKSYPAIGERLRPSLWKNSKCADPATRIQQKPIWPGLKRAQPGSDRSMNWQRETYKSHECQHHMASAGRLQQRLLKLYHCFVNAIKIRPYEKF